MSDREPSDSAPPSLGESPLFKDLAALYDNPEVFSDPNTPLLPRFRLVSHHITNRPTILTVEISDDLIFALREQGLAMLRTIPEFEAEIATHFETSDWEATHSRIVADPSYLAGEREMYWFFILNFPRLAARIYDITARIAVAYTVRKNIPEVERLASEKDLNSALATMLREMLADIRQMLGTRKRGGSTAKLTGDLRTSLHLEYDKIHAITKIVKKQCDTLRKAFASTRHRAGQTEWQDFWKESAVRLFPEYATTFLELFATAESPSASEVAYAWLAQRTGLSQSYVTKIVKDLRKRSRTNVNNGHLETN